MNAEALIEEARSRGVRIEAVGDRLRLSPRRAVPPELLEQARRLRGISWRFCRPRGRTGRTP